MLYKPKALSKGDVVGVIAPSDAVDKAGLEGGLEQIRDWGLKVRLGKYVFSKVGDFFAGSGEERQEDLKEMILDPEVRVIWTASGGYAATEVLPALTREVMKSLQADAKFIIGYSDVCMVLNALTSYRIVNLMGPTVWGLPEWNEESREVIRKILFGEEHMQIGMEKKWGVGVAGVVEGGVVAANLETLIFSFGTRFDPLMYGSGPVILVLEELDIEKSTLQRQIDVILAHKRSARIVGIVVGRMVNIRELSYPEWGKDVTVQEIITARVKKWGKGKVPLTFCDDFGHAEWDYEDIPDSEKAAANHTFLTIPNCVSARLTVTSEGCKLEYCESICKSI